jgi:myo-inositol-1(or 4)-monophosphatase
MRNDFGEILAVAREAAIEGAAVHHQGLTRHIGAQIKSSDMDLVTEIDSETERVIVEYILQARPDDTIIAEEGTFHLGKSGVCWIIDPLDGTVNYLHRYPAFGISIGVEIENTGAIGVIYDTFNDKIYSGAIDKQAACDDEPISVSGCAELKNALISTGFLPNSQIRGHQCMILSEILPHIRDIRRSGSPVIDFCRVASGETDGFFEFGLGKWDIAAGSVIAQAAGAKVTLLSLESKISPLVLASAPKIHDELLELALKSWERHKV